MVSGEYAQRLLLDDPPPEEDGFGVESEEATDTALGQFTIIESIPEVTVTEPFLVQAVG